MFTCFVCFWIVLRCLQLFDVIKLFLCSRACSVVFVVGCLDWVKLFKLFRLVLVLSGCFLMFRLLLIALVSLISFSLVLGMCFVVYGLCDRFHFFNWVVFVFVWVTVGFVQLVLVVLFQVVLGCGILC